MKIVTYEQRVSKMKVLGDEQIELKRAKSYVMRLRKKTTQCQTLDEKLEILQAVKEAESVLRKLRCNIFKLEDMLSANSVPS